MRLAALLVAVLLLPGAAADGHAMIVPAGASKLSAVVESGAGEQTIRLELPFRLLEERDVYAKVVPAEVPDKPDLNPHLRGHGWNVHVLLDGNEVGAMPGYDVVSLGTLAPNTTFTLGIAITVPPNRTANVEKHEFLFSVVARSASSSSGSGGVLDPSLSIPGMIRVVDRQSEGQGGADGFPTQQVLQFLASIAALVVVIFALAVGRKQWSRYTARRRERWAKELTDEELDRIRGGER